MMTLYRQISLSNGLTLQIYDQSRRYFGDYFHVKMEISCTVSLSGHVGSVGVDLEEARKLLGDEVTYRRYLDKMAVSSHEVAQVQQQLLADFCKHSQAYFESPAFPEKLIAAELRRARQKMRVRF